MLSLSKPRTLAERAEYKKRAKVELLEDTPNVALPRLFTDTLGKSHFGEARIATALTDFAPPASPMYISEPVEANRTLFLVFPIGWLGKPHPVPNRQLMVCLNGTIEVTASDGERRLFNPGDFCLVEDTTGEGHMSKNVGTEPVVMSVTQY